MEYTIIQTSNQKKRSKMPKKREASKKEALVASTSKSKVNQPPQEGKKKKRKNFRKPYSQTYRISKIQKDAIENVFNMERTLMEFKDKEEKRMRQTHFPKKSSCALMF
ncbi:hypothetical protein O181_083290 [Austropuccinia psidii MF-1]|uniref:Uncharacterized protein n=1 Tax=Austropuccinia psidii MF-1 TaxID=1389203 RepID=A0A9Q3FTG9_9BASI|nr:hypothetical protein [Austropuccinia psidii MF-1]